MKISTKGQYALRMLVDLAEHQSEGYVSLKDVARRQEISKKYLEQIVSVFNRGDVLQTNRGSQGGYRLAKSPDRYTVGEILRITEGDLSPVDYSNPGQTGGEAALLPVWQELDRVICAYLDSVTLQDVLDRHRESGADNYVI